MPAWAAAMASTVPIGDDDLGLHVEEVGRRSRTRRAAPCVRDRSSPMLAARLSADREQGEVGDAGGDEPEADHLDRSSAVDGTAHGDDEARRRRAPRTARCQPPGERGDPHRGVDRRALGDPDGDARGRPSGSASASCGLVSARPSGARAAWRRRRRRAGGCADPGRSPECSSRTPAWNRPWNAVGRHELGDDRPRARAGRSTARRATAGCCSMGADDLVGDLLADGGLLEHVGGRRRRTPASWRTSANSTARPWPGWRAAARGRSRPATVVRASADEVPRPPSRPDRSRRARSWATVGSGVDGPAGARVARAGSPGGRRDGRPAGHAGGAGGVHPGRQRRRRGDRRQRRDRRHRSPPVRARRRPLRPRPHGRRRGRRAQRQRAGPGRAPTPPPCAPRVT